MYSAISASHISYMNSASHISYVYEFGCIDFASIDTFLLVRHNFYLLCTFEFALSSLHNNRQNPKNLGYHKDAASLKEQILQQCTRSV